MQEIYLQNLKANQPTSFPAIVNTNRQTDEDSEVNTYWKKFSYVITRIDHLHLGCICDGSFSSSSFVSFNDQKRTAFTLYTRMGICPAKIKNIKCKTHASRQLNSQSKFFCIYHLSQGRNNIIKFG